MITAPNKESANLPTRLGRYQLNKRIGRGAMASVYKATGPDGQPLALKILARALQQNERALRRFEREGRAASRLNHPNIVRVYELGEAQGRHYIAMEFVPGVNLDRYLRRWKRLTSRAGLQVAICVTRALEHAHAHGIVHRDIKPSNILISPKHVKLADLGLALDLHHEEEEQLTRAGMTLGTMDYIAPEQARSGHEADTRSDLYSLGCTIYRMFTGQPPFPGGSPIDKVFNHLRKTPADPRELVPGLPDAIVEIMGRLMKKSPDDRYQSPTDLLWDLEAISKRNG